MITNNGYLDNPTFRGMRWHLASTFDSIYVLDLHGSSKKKETAPDGGKDENVFDIQQGVAIIIATKLGKKKMGQFARIYHADLFGKRKEKFERLESGQQDWKEVSLDKQMFYFVQKDNKGRGEYEKGIKINELFKVYGTGVLTMGDNFIVSNTREELGTRITRLLSDGYDEQSLNAGFGLGKNYAKWVISNKSDIVFDEARIVNYAYRPFDLRFTYFDNKLIWRHREKVMRHFAHENIGIDICRQNVSKKFSHVFVVNTFADDSLVSNKTKERGYVAPLYLYGDEGVY